MKVNEQSIQQIERAIKKVAAKFPAGEEATQLTDIHLQVKQDSGELLAFDDDDHELTRCVVEEWIGNKDENFYDGVREVLRQCLKNLKEVVDSLSLLKPYSFVLVDDDKETLAELYLVDDDTVMLDDQLLKGLDKELDDFLDGLLKD